MTKHAHSGIKLRKLQEIINWGIVLPYSSKCIRS